MNSKKDLRSPKNYNSNKNTLSSEKMAIEENDFKNENPENTVTAAKSEYLQYFLK